MAGVPDLSAQAADRRLAPELLDTGDRVVGLCVQHGASLLGRGRSGLSVVGGLVTGNGHRWRCLVPGSRVDVRPCAGREVGVDPVRVAGESVPVRRTAASRRGSCSCSWRAPRSVAAALAGAARVTSVPDIGLDLAVAVGDQLADVWVVGVVHGSSLWSRRARVSTPVMVCGRPHRARGAPAGAAVDSRGARVALRRWCRDRSDRHRGCRRRRSG